MGGGARRLHGRGLRFGCGRRARPISEMEQTACQIGETARRRREAPEAARPAAPDCADPGHRRPIFGQGRADGVLHDSSG